MNTTLQHQNKTSFKIVPNISPTITGDKKIIMGNISTPIGTIVVAATDEGVCFLGFSDQKRFDRDLANLQQQLQAILVPGMHRYFPMVNQQLEEYFAGQRTQFTLPLVMVGTDFQKRVWHSLLEIPYGETYSYLQQAKQLGKPEAVRAVAQANGRNRIAILIPCHRVIGSDGTLTGYGAGLPRKEWLLAHEAKR